MDDDYNAAYQRGAEARLDGSHRDGNPYPCFMSQHDDWFDGWIDMDRALSIKETKGLN